MSLLMAIDPNVAELNVYDLKGSVVPAEGVAADLDQLCSQARVRGFQFERTDRAVDKAEACLTGCDLVLIPAGVPRKPGQSRSDLLDINAGIAQNVVEGCARWCPGAVLGLIVNPVNSVVPAMCELWTKKGLDSRKIVGVTSLDMVRSAKFVHEKTGAKAEAVKVPVVGGHAGSTILPLFSQDKFAGDILAADVPALDVKVQEAGTAVVNAKAGKGSATMAMAYAGARLGGTVLRGLKGEAVPAEERTECAYVKSSITELPYFSSKVTFGPLGVEKVHDLGKLSQYEADRLEKLKPVLQSEIQEGLDYAATRELAGGSMAKNAMRGVMVAYGCVIAVRY